MGPGDRFKIRWLGGGFSVGIWYHNYPYKHTIGIDLLLFRVELGFGLPYTDPDY